MQTLCKLTGQALNLQELALTDTNDQALQDTLEGLKGEIDEKVGACAVVIKNLQYQQDLIAAQAVLLRAEIARINKRKDALELNVCKIKDSMIASMQALDITTCKTLTQTISCVTQKKIDINYDLLHERFVVYQIPKINISATKKRVSELADALENLAGITHVESSHITIR